MSVRLWHGVVAVGAIATLAFLVGIQSQPQASAGGMASALPAFPPGLLSAGSTHACMITAGGGVACWGGNDSGQLGDGTFATRRSPVMVSGLGSGVKAITTGWFHTCALLEGGGVRCWGRNSSGALGNGASSNSAVPVEVQGLSDVTAISAGGDHTCALRSNGAVTCWGANGNGELGDGTIRNSNVPVVALPAGSGTRAVAAGGMSTCVLTATDGVRCWGDNALGELGNDSHTDSLSPVDVTGLGSPVAAISGGYGHYCAILQGGSVKCWGLAGWGQLGAGSAGANSPLPLTVANLPVAAVGITTGHSHTCAVLADNSTWCWGLNQSGEVGDGSNEIRGRPVRIAGPEKQFGAIAAGGDGPEFFTCARSEHELTCWGGNSSGQIARTETGGVLVPTRVSLGPARLSFLTKPAGAMAGRAFAVQPEVRVEDVLGNMTFWAFRHTGVTLSVADGPGSVSCDGGTSLKEDMGVAHFRGCQLSASGHYRLRATADEPLGPAEVELDSFAFRGAIGALAKDAAGAGPKALYAGDARFHVSWPTLPPDHVVCGRIEKFRNGERVFYAYRFPEDGCDFGLPTNVFPAGYTIDVSSWPDLKDVRSGDTYCFHLDERPTSGLVAYRELLPLACTTIG